MDSTANISIAGIQIPCFFFNTVVVGSGAAGLNAADYLWSCGQKNVAIVTEGLYMGTSRNTGSDKQTYYKTSAFGTCNDSIQSMAHTLAEGGSMDGDIALAESAVSAQGFYRLVDMGVPFPHNAYGEFVGYKTDHDPGMHGTSAGPLTSKYMTECLHKKVIQDGIPIFDFCQVIEILTVTENGRKSAVGLLAVRVDTEQGEYVAFSATNIIYATGGEAGLYAASAYPPSQTGSTGIAFRAGAMGKNLTEWQYGIASTKFRWNLSGTYQQVLPRYISTDQNGNDEREFLEECFEDKRKFLTAIFLKGYQWPFDPRKAFNGGSSLIDILVYDQTIIKGRRVFLDYTKNPACAQTNGHMDFSKVESVVLKHLEKSQALLEKPIDRLAQMNPGAIALYKNHQIDLHKDRLEAAVCVQHNNGGLAANFWWENNISHLFTVGEVCGTHGAYRPGGSALNAGQVGGIRAGQYISHHYNQSPLDAKAFSNLCGEQIARSILFGQAALTSSAPPADLPGMLLALQTNMSCHGAIIRSHDGLEAAKEAAIEQLCRINGAVRIQTAKQLPFLYRIRDLLTSQYMYICAMLDYVKKGGKSRGSYIVQDKSGEKPISSLSDEFLFCLDGGEFSSKIQEVIYQEGECQISWRETRPIPNSQNWFEIVWKDYCNGDIYL